MTRPIRLVHVLSSLTTGGAEINTVRLVEALADRGFEQMVVSQTGEIDPVFKNAFRVPLLYPQDAGYKPCTAFYLSRIARGFSADIIHGRAFRGWINCVAAKWLCRNGVRLVQSFHGPTSFEYHMVRRGFAVIGLRGSTDAFVGVSQDLAKRLIKQWAVPKDKVFVISNGIEMNKYSQTPDSEAAKTRLGIDKRRFIVGAVGSLREVKNHRLLLEAFTLFNTSRKDSMLLLVGQGPLRAELEKQARALGVADQVKFYGFQSDIQGYLEAMDVFVQPSDREGSPTAVLEAMAGGLTTVATRSAGCVELNASHDLPLLVDSDNPDDMAQCLIELAADPDRRIKMGQMGRRIVADSYSFDRMVDSYENLYRSLMAAGSKPLVLVCSEMRSGENRMVGS